MKLASKSRREFTLALDRTPYPPSPAELTAKRAKAAVDGQDGKGGDVDVVAVTITVVVTVSKGS